MTRPAVPWSSKRQPTISMVPRVGPFDPHQVEMMAEKALWPRVTQFSIRTDTGLLVAWRGIG